MLFASPLYAYFPEPHLAVNFPTSILSSKGGECLSLPMDISYGGDDPSRFPYRNIPLDLFIVVDDSGSMSNYSAGLKKSLTDSVLNDISINDRVALLTASRKEIPLTDNKSEVIEAINSLSFYGKGSVCDALTSLKEERGRMTFVLLATDGWIDCDLKPVLSDFSSRNLPIHVLFFDTKVPTLGGEAFNGLNDMIAAGIAQQTGGNNFTKLGPWVSDKKKSRGVGDATLSLVSKYPFGAIYEASIGNLAYGNKKRMMISICPAMATFGNSTPSLNLPPGNYTPISLVRISYTDGLSGNRIAFELEPNVTLLVTGNTSGNVSFDINPSLNAPCPSCWWLTKKGTRLTFSSDEKTVRFSLIGHGVSQLDNSTFAPTDMGTYRAIAMRMKNGSVSAVGQESFLAMFPYPDEQTALIFKRDSTLNSFAKLHSFEAPIVEIADSVCSGKTETRCAEALVQYTKATMAKYDDFHEDFDVLDIVSNRKGWCTDYTNFFNSLARTAGLPSRAVYMDMSDGGHLFSEVYLDGKWIHAEPQGHFDDEGYYVRQGWELEGVWAEGPEKPLRDVHVQDLPLLGKSVVKNNFLGEGVSGESRLKQYGVAFLSPCNEERRGVFVLEGETGEINLAVKNAMNSETASSMSISASEEEGLKLLGTEGLPSSLGPGKEATVKANIKLEGPVGMLTLLLHHDGNYVKKCKVYVVKAAVKNETK